MLMVNYAEIKSQDHPFITFSSSINYSEVYDESFGSKELLVHYNYKKFKDPGFVDGLILDSKITVKEYCRHLEIARNN